MTGVLLASDSPRVGSALREAIGPDAKMVPSSALVTDSPKSLLAINEASTVVLDADADFISALSFAARCKAHEVAVVMLSSDPASIALAAMRAGVVDVLQIPVEPKELREACLKAERHAMELATISASGVGQSTARVITVASPKGGVGKTTVSTNLAVGLAQQSDSVVIVDLDIHFGDVASGLNLAPRYTLPDACTGATATDGMALKSLMSVHTSGLFVIPGSDSPATADEITAGQVATLLDTLAMAFEYVIIDTAPGLGEHALSALDTTTDLVLVTSMDVPGVRGLRKELATLNDLSLLPMSTNVVLNFCDSSRGLSLKDVEATIERSVDYQLPLVKDVPVSTNQGDPILLSNRRSPFAKRLGGLVEKLTGPQPATRTLTAVPRRGQW